MKAMEAPRLFAPSRQSCPLPQVTVTARVTLVQDPGGRQLSCRARRCHAGREAAIVPVLGTAAGQGSEAPQPNTKHLKLLRALSILAAPRDNAQLYPSCSGHGADQDQLIPGASPAPCLEPPMSKELKPCPGQAKKTVNGIQGKQDDPEYSSAPAQAAALHQQCFSTKYSLLLQLRTTA